MLEEKLLSKDYYISKLSIFMQQSYGVTSQVEYFVEFIQDIDTVCDLIASIHNLNNLEDLLNDGTFDKDGYVCDPLDTVADIMNISRNVNIEIYDEENDTSTTRTLTLNNLELLLYIKFTILKSNFNGTRKSLIDLYNSVLPISNESGLLMLDDIHTPLTCNIWLNLNSPYFKENNLENFIDLFLYTDLFVESLGIKYIKNTTNAFDTMLILVDTPISTEVDKWKDSIKKAMLYPEKVKITTPTGSLPKYYFETSVLVEDTPTTFYFGTTDWYDKEGIKIENVSDLISDETYYLDWEMIEDPTGYELYPSSDTGNDITITSDIQRLG